MIWRIVTKFADLAAAPPGVPSSVAYAAFDGLFQHALIGHLAGHAAAARNLERDVQHVPDSLIVRG